MDTGAQQDTPDAGANASGTETAENAGAGDKSTGIDKGKNPKVPEVQTDPASASPGQATPAAPEQPAPKTLASEKTIAASTETKTFKMTQIIKTALALVKTTSVPVKLAPTTGKTAATSSTMTLHTGKGAARVSTFHTPELEGRVSLRTKSDNSLGSLKEYCMKWNNTDFVDTPSSGKKKALAGTPAPGNPDVIPAKPIAIASELFSIQQRLYRLTDARNVSIFPHISPVPKNIGCLG
jgi:hypothetical protein